MNLIQLSIERANVSNLNLASLSLSEGIDDTSSGRGQRLSRGWGSQETRKAYSSLHTLVDCQDQSQNEKSNVQRITTITSNSSSVTDQQQSCDFFVSNDDDMDCDQNFWWLYKKPITVYITYNIYAAHNLSPCIHIFTNKGNFYVTRLLAGFREYKTYSPAVISFGECTWKELQNP